MKNCRVRISSFFLVIFSAFLTCSCISSAEDEKNEILIDRIQERISTHNYKITNRINSGYSQLRKSSKAATKAFKLKNSYRLKNNYRKVKNSSSGKIFSFVSNPKVSQVKLNETWGLDNPNSIDELTNNLYDYYGGTFSTDQIRLEINSVNSTLTQYSHTYSGANDFFQDQLNSGAITQTQHQLLEIWLNALVSANSVNEAIEITVMVEQEILNSSTNNDLLLQLTSSSLGILDEEAIALSGENEVYFFKTGTVAVVVGVIGMVVCGVMGALSDQNSDQNGGWAFGGVISAFVMFAGIATME